MSGNPIVARVTEAIRGDGSHLEAGCRKTLNAFLRRSLAHSNTGELEFLNHEILFERTGKVLNITNREVQQAITQRCVDTKVKVLILDNLSTVASGMKENEADSWELENNWLLDLRRRRIGVCCCKASGFNRHRRNVLTAAVSSTSCPVLRST